MNKELLEQQLAQLPLYTYFYIDPKDLEFSDRIRYICSAECPMYDKTWACPPAVGAVAQCKERCLSYQNCLLIGTITETEDISNLEATLATRADHEALTNQVRQIFQAQGIAPYILSTEACAICEKCAWLEGQPCRYPERMHPCLESHGIVATTLADTYGIEYLYGPQVVTWFSILLYR